MTTKEEDTLLDIFTARSLDTVLFFSNKGKVYSEKAYNIPETGRANKGTLIFGVLNMLPDEKITAVLPVSSFEDGAYFVMATRGGRIKRVDLEEFVDVRPSGLIAMSLEDGDVLEWVKATDGDQDVILVTDGGQSIRFHESSVRAMGRQAAGVNAIRLQDDDQVAGMDVVDENHTHMVVITQQGYGKRTALDEYKSQGRYGLGVRTLARNEKTGPIVAMRCMNDSDDILLITREGVVLRTGLDEIRDTGRNTQGVRVMKPVKGDEVVGMTLMAAEPLTEGVEGETDEAVNGNGAVHEPLSEITEDVIDDDADEMDDTEDTEDGDDSDLATG
jgi:DNA gyrase subunit A